MCALEPARRLIDRGPPSDQCTLHTPEKGNQMTKYFVAEAMVQTTIKFEVAAETEQDAQLKATEQARMLAQPGFVTKLTLTPDGETEYVVGRKVKHELFGVGTILEIGRTSNYRDEHGYSLRIKFDSGDEKSIHAPLPKGKLTAVDV
jgi:hypothetical protein